MGVAERQADIIVVATLERGSPESLTRIGAQLRVLRVLKGTAPPPLIAVELVPPSMMTTHARSLQDHVPGRLIGSAGIWFIKEGADATFRLIPLATGDFVWEEVFLRLQTAELPEPAAVLPDLAEFDNSARRFILAALVDSYMSSADPFTLRDLVVVSLNDPENRQDSLAAAKALVASGSPDHQILGLGAALRLGSDEALQWLAEKAPALQSHPMYASLVFALSTEYKPNGEASIVPLRQLVAARAGGVNFDASVAAALRKTGTKAAVPALVELLDSPDRTAQLHAARFLSEYALFADANGNIPGPVGPGRIAGPWGTEATQAHMPSRNSDRAAEEYAAFWKSWWAENKTKLGFTEP